MSVTLVVVEENSPLTHTLPNPYPQIQIDLYGEKNNNDDNASDIRAMSVMMVVVTENDSLTATLPNPYPWIENDLHGEKNNDNDSDDGGSDRE